MCYGMNCEWEGSLGNCRKPRGIPCPEPEYDDEENCMEITHGHPAEEAAAVEAMMEDITEAAYV